MSRTRKRPLVGPFRKPPGRRLLISVLAGWYLLACGACGPKSPLDQLSRAGPLSASFAVSEFFSPSGDMGDGAVPGPLTTDINENCKERPVGARGDCYRFTYVPSTQLWAGVYWQYPSNNWGTQHGWPIEQRTDQAGVTLPIFTTVRFKAASNVELDALGSAMPVQFIVGGINGGFQYSDAFKFNLFKTDVSTEWKDYAIDISGIPLSSVIGAFCWVTNYPPNTDPATVPPHVLYLDDVVWE
jgi:hypothetical protein